MTCKRRVVKISGVVNYISYKLKLRGNEVKLFKVFRENGLGIGI